MNCYDRMDVEALRGIPLCDMEPTQLIAFIRKKYPYDRIGALQYMREHNQIGNILYNNVRLILEGIK